MTVTSWFSKMMSRGKSAGMRVWGLGVILTWIFWFGLREVAGLRTGWESIWTKLFLMRLVAWVLESRWEAKKVSNLRLVSESLVVKILVSVISSKNFFCQFGGGFWERGGSEGMGNLGWIFVSSLGFTKPSNFEGGFEDFRNDCFNFGG